MKLCFLAPPVPFRIDRENIDFGVGENLLFMGLPCEGVAGMSIESCCSICSQTIGGGQLRISYWTFTFSSDIVVVPVHFHAVCFPAREFQTVCATLGRECSDETIRRPNLWRSIPIFDDVFQSTRRDVDIPSSIQEEAIWRALQPYVTQVRKIGYVLRRSIGRGIY